MSLEGAIAVHRFGLGARPGEMAAASAAPKRWLIEQLDSPVEQPQPLDGEGSFDNIATLVAQYHEFTDDRKRYRQALAAGNADNGTKALQQDRQKAYQREMSARFALGFITSKPFAERLVWFWTNHFSISANAGAVLTMAGDYEREVIRPHVMGKFGDMLLASARHPAMLDYLNNATSVSPNSRAAEHNHRGINENYGREVMELHTLGVDGGYTQTDVIALAEILTGWSLASDGNATGFQFYPRQHEPGVVVLRGKTYSGGEEEGVAALRDLAHDPATARHIAQKFATYFISDDPPKDSIEKLQAVFLKTGGDLKALAITVVNDPNAWKPQMRKMRSPVEFVTASLRFVGWPQGGDSEKQVKAAMGAARLMGEFPMAAPSPKGWPDYSEAWSGADSLLNRIEWAKGVGARIPQGFDVASAAADGLGPLLRPETKSAMTGVAPGDAVALLMSSPEFQRR